MKASYLALSLYAASIVLLSSVQCNALNSNWFFSIEPDSVQCIDIILPDDVGYFGKGIFEYTIKCEPLDECVSWGATVTDERVTASENNTGIIPVCFNSFGKPLGNCSSPMKLVVSSTALEISKSWEGGICVSRYRDFEKSGRRAGESVEDVLDNNFALIDAKLSQPVIYTTPSKRIIYPIYIESYANTTLDVSISSENLDIAQTSFTVSLSRDNPHKTLNITINTPSKQGRYRIVAKITSRNCKETYCSKTIDGVVYVSNDTSKMAGFSVSLFPDSINIKENKPVIFKYTIHNYGKRDRFALSLSISPSGSALSTFKNHDIELETGEEISKNFLVTPLNASTMYEITLSASSNYNGKKRVTSRLSVNEMLTDVARQADSITDVKARRDAKKSIDEWYQSYRNSEYGKNLDKYESLKDVIAEAKPAPHQKPESANTTQDAQAHNSENQDSSLLLPFVILVLAIAVIILLYKFLISNKNNESEEDFEYY